MNRIRLLPDQVANQIAAGEVVERPASVVKELVENALDAQPTRIQIEIQAGGRSLIRVTDDGVGMSRDDALLCLERHATSKIRRAEDLSAIVTMGFRGEALPSIASVSRTTLTSREREGEIPSATQIIISGGKILDVKTAGSPVGTSVEVRQLFFNLPARRKFLRSEETEYGHIHHYLTLAALAYPEVAFTFLKDGRMVWQLPAVGTENPSGPDLPGLRERLRALLGNADQLLPVDFSAELTATEPAGEDDADVGSHLGEEASPASPSVFRLWGFIGKPGVSRSTREDQHLFVNRRPVENKGLNFALLEGYHTALMKGQYPVACLFLEIDPAWVDVNIHPSKREVKFHNERAVRQWVARAVRETLLRFHTAPAASGQKAALPAERVDASSAAAALGRPALAAETESVKPGLARGGEAASALSSSEGSVLPLQPAVEQSRGERPGTGPSGALNVSGGSVTVAGVSSVPPAGSGPTPLLNVPLRLVGVIGKLYVVLESDRGLVLLDQHAAHERILFEQMLKRLEQGPAPSQRLLLPETVELSVRDAQFLREQLPTLTRLGTGLSEFGERTFLLDALPPFVKVSDARRFVLGLVDELKAVGQEVNSLRLGEHTIAKTVCRHAVKANDPLAGPELENLVNDLRQCAMPYTCPHGRPTLIEMNYRELDKKFGRLQ